MTKRSRYEREQRAAGNVKVKQITADWERAVPPERAAAFALEWKAARSWAGGHPADMPRNRSGTRRGSGPRTAPPKKEETAAQSIRRRTHIGMFGGPWGP